MNERARLRALDAGEVNDSVDDLWHMHLAVDSDEGNHSARVCVGERRRYPDWHCHWLSDELAYGYTLRPMPMATATYSYAYGCLCLWLWCLIL